MMYCEIGRSDRATHRLAPSGVTHTPDTTPSCSTPRRRDSPAPGSQRLSFPLAVPQATFPSGVNANAALDIVQRCQDGEWTSSTDCADLGKTCDETNGRAQCVAVSDIDSDAETDTDTVDTIDAGDDDNKKDITCQTTAMMPRENKVSVIELSTMLLGYLF